MRTLPEINGICSASIAAAKRFRRSRRKKKLRQGRSALSAAHDGDYLSSLRRREHFYLFACSLDSARFSFAGFASSAFFVSSSVGTFCVRRAGSARSTGFVALRIVFGVGHGVLIGALIRAVLYSERAFHRRGCLLR